MACYRPIPARQDRDGAQVRLHPELGTANLHIPCGQCVGCKTDRANQWAHRCEHEASQWENNIFLTLTYDDEHLPRWGYLDAAELTKFFKRTRKSVNRRDSSIQCSKGIIRYFACGEYGTKNGRPHYHVLLFNCEFADRIKVAERDGLPVYQSAELSRLWPFGRHEYGAALPRAANYIAQYSLKKQRSGYNHNDRVHGYGGVQHIDTTTGELLPKPAPFLRMSLKPGIGSEWLHKFQYDLQHGYLVNNGRRFKIPRTYRKRLELHNPGLAEDIAIRTIQHRRTLNPENTNNDDRRHAAEVIHERRKQLTENRDL